MAKRDPTAWMRAEYEALVAQSLDWKLRVLQGPSAPRSVVDGKRVIMLCSNNYLNLSNHPKVKRAAREAVKTHGAGSGSVRPIAGNMDLHEELERRIARFKRRGGLVLHERLRGERGTHPPARGRRGRDPDGRAEPREHHRRCPPDEGATRDLSTLRRRGSRAGPQRSRRLGKEDPRHHRWGVLHGRRHRAGRGHRAGR